MTLVWFRNCYDDDTDGDDDDDDDDDDDWSYTEHV